MTVLEPSELQASPLADLHAIADQLGLDGYRRLRKDELIEAILAGSQDRQPGQSIGGFERVRAGGGRCARGAPKPPASEDSEEVAGQER